MTDSTQGAFHIEHEATPDGPLIRPVGELDIATADALTGALDEALRSDADRVVLDLSAVSFIDSAGIRCLLLATAASEAVGDKLRVRREHSEQVTRLLDLIGALDRLPYE
jgi:anti-anti-sigma factor